MSDAMDTPLNRAPLSLLLAALIARADEASWVSDEARDMLESAAGRIVADFAAAHPEEHARASAQAVAMLARGKS